MADIPNIDELIIKFLSGNAKPEEAMLLEDWKNANESNLHYFESCVKIFGGEKIINASSQETEKAWKALKSEISVQPKVIPIRNSFYFLRVAASIALLVGVTVFFYYRLNDKTHSAVTYTAAMDSKSVKLPDGTDITIAPHSSVTQVKDFGKTNRVLQLHGSAYFSVVHQEKLPLIIDAGHVYIKDIGTKFYISTSSNTDTIYVKVDEGEVLLFDSLNNTINIKRSKKAMYIRSLKKIQIPQAKQAEMRKLNFVNMRLANVMDTLSKEYHIPIFLQNKAIGKCRITTHFSNENIETILSVITETMGFEYEKTAKGYLIKGNKCIE